MIYAIDTFPGRTISVNGKSFLYFGGTSYLGLQTDATFQRVYRANLKKYGTNYGASRKANVQISIFQETENYLANLVGSESCITMSSGFLAGQLVIQTMNTPEHEFFYAPESHSAVHLASKRPFQHFSDLNQAVRKHLEDSNSTPVVVLDAIDLLGKGYPGFEGLQALPLNEVVLVIDDSHGIGIVGIDGGGAFKSAQSLNAKELIVCCSLGKGFGIQAGAIFAKTNRIQKFTTTNFFGGASPAAPAALATLLESSELFAKKRQILQKNIRVFLDTLQNHKLLNYQDHYPAFYFSNPKIAKFLESKRILITNFNYPNENSPLRSRIVISAAHTTEDIGQLTQWLNLY